MSAVLAYLPRGNTLSDEAWSKRHLLLQWLLLLHIPGLFIFGLTRGYTASDVAGAVAVPFACLVLGRLLRTRRLASFFITAGLVYCSAALVGLSGGSIEAHFHFFIMIGFIALYQDWVPFLWNIVFTVLSHGFGSAFRSDLIFNHHAGIAHPWTWSLLHGIAVLAACGGVVLFWKQTEDEQNKTITLRGELAATELRQRRFVSDLLVNLARRNQNLLYRQLDLLNQLEENEQDPDALAQLFRLDHLATRIRRNAENLLVLSGEEPPRKWGHPVPLVDVVRAAIAETEDLDRVDFAVDEGLAVAGRAVADTTHVLAELIENAVHFSPPGVGVMLRTRPYLPNAGAQVLTIEDWGVGMSAEELAAANRTLATPAEVDLSVSQRLGLHVVARLARRYGIRVSLTSTPGGGVTAVVLLPSELFDARDVDATRATPLRRTTAPVLSPAPAGVPALQATTLAPPPPPRPAAFPPLSAAPPGRAEPAPIMMPPSRSLSAPPPPPPLPPTPVPLAGRAGQPIEIPAESTSNGWNNWWTPHQAPGGNGNGTSNGTGNGSGAAGGAGAPATPPPPPVTKPIPAEPAANPPAANPPAANPPAANPPAAPKPSTAGAPPAAPPRQATPPPAAPPRQATPPSTAPPRQTAGPSPAPPPTTRPNPVPPAPTTPAQPTPALRPPSNTTSAAGTTVTSSTASTADPAPPAPGGPRLTQRVPQTHLVDGLRRPSGPLPDPQPLRDPEQAREALSRFQASQRAARAVLDEQSAGGSHPAGGSQDGQQRGSNRPEERRR